MKKQLVRIKADGVQSKYGYIVEEEFGVAIIKVAIKGDATKCLDYKNCVILGETLYKKIN